MFNSSIVNYQLNQVKGMTPPHLPGPQQHPLPPHHPSQSHTHSPWIPLKDNYSFASCEFVNVHIHAHTGQYNLMKIMNNTVITHVVNISGSENQTYTIRIKDKHSEIRAQQIFNQTDFEILFEWLRPCTVYTVSVDECTSNGNNTFTSSQGEETVPKTIVKSLTDNEVCLKGQFTDIQWNLTECVEITEQNSCTSTHTVSNLKYDSMQLFPLSLSGLINQDNVIVCLKSFAPTAVNKEDTFVLNEEVLLLLNEQYNCTGEYSYEKRLIKSNALSFQIPCDGQKKTQFVHSTSTTFEISWNSLNKDQCSGIVWESFSASCSDSALLKLICAFSLKYSKVFYDISRSSRSLKSYSAKPCGISTTCSITGLLPYKKYKCSIKGKVSGKDYEIYTGENTTLSAKPDFKSEIEVTHPDHNSLQIKCENKGPKIIWNGGKGKFKANITNSGRTISKTSDTCSFTFSDLYYLTTYDITITAENTEGFSKVNNKHEATTKYNDKAVVGLLAFLIVVTSVALLFVPFKMYHLKRKRSVSQFLTAVPTL
ncbi:Receptor-type tyrosine-protein phosphatase C [Labeo rohita]|uniref:Receptor-type tyrosine-protein phosphatase C n=1 Tax=Labeo rohita TaxID=84645 RepID=A0ABQ8LIZ0_LABRO|nr:Receptor-type tyrosine-protein phosphatase C [Labeo rohita]